MVRKYKAGWFEDVETELHRRVMELERDLTAEIMEGHDVDAGAIEVPGKEHRRVRSRSCATFKPYSRFGCAVTSFRRPHYRRLR